MLTFSGRTAEDRFAAEYLTDQFREAFSECDLSIDKTGLLGANGFRNFVQQMQASLSRNNLEVPMPNEEQLNELFDSTKSKSEGVSFEDIQSRMMEVNEMVSEIIKMPKKIAVAPKLDEVAPRSQEQVQDGADWLGKEGILKCG